VLNRVSEDGVLAPWFRAPHKKYGTSYRIINLIFILQLLAIAGSRGQTYVLGEAYAFGVIWSFSFNALSMMVLRLQKKERREWKVPINLKIGHFELPIGLGTVMTILFFVAGINLITKQVATISGILFTTVFFFLFLISERITEKRRIAEGADSSSLDQFRLQPQEAVSTETVEVRPGNTICLVRDYNTLGHVSKALELTHTGKTDLVVMTVQLLRGPNTGYEDIAEDQLFTSYEQMLFSRVVSLAEKAGKHIDLLVVPSSDVSQAIALTAAQLDSARIIAGRSSVMTSAEQAKRIGAAWEKLPYKPKHKVTFLVVEPDGRFNEYSLGAHAPQLSDEDINLIHNLWLELVKEHGTEDLHHREVVRICLTRLQKEINGGHRRQIIKEFHDLKTKLRREEKDY
ncbi:MAG: APC family permease, partial [Pyrinomonadaceae bacterium]